MLIREGNQHLYRAKSAEGEEAQEQWLLVQNFEALVDQIRQIALQKVKYIEKGAEMSENVVVGMIKGIDGGAGLIGFIRDAILETTECQKAQADPSTGRGHPSSDLDEIIRERFMRRTRNRLHGKVLEYIHKSMQVLLHDHRPDFSDQDLIVVLRLLDCLAWDSASPFDEVRHQSAFKPEYTQTLMDICDAAQDVQIIKLVAMVLANAATARAWPQTDAALRQQNRLLIKFAVFAEAGGQLLHAATKQGSDVSKLIEQVRKSFNVRLHLDPEKVLAKKEQHESSESVDSEKEDSIEDESAETSSGVNILADYAQAQLHSTAASGSDGSDKAKAIKSVKSSKIEISFEDGIEAFVQAQTRNIAEIREKAKQESGEMEIDAGAGGPSAQTKVTLRDVAQGIFEERVQASYQEIVQKATLSKASKTWDQFKSEFPDYVEDSISFIEANLIFSKFIVNDSTFQLAVECSLSCQKRLIQKLDHFHGAKGSGPRISKVFCGRVQSFVSRQIVRNCMHLARSSAAASAPELQKHISCCVAQLQALKQYLRKIKETEPGLARASGQALRELAVKPVAGAKPFLLDMLQQIGNIEVANEDGEAVLRFAPNIEEAGQIPSNGEPAKNIFPLSRALLTDHRFQTNIWLVAQQVYEILCNVLRHANLPQLDPEQHQQFTRIKKEIETQAQKVLLKGAFEFKSKGEERHIFVHNIDMLRLIVQYFIRSAWVLEGLAQPAGEPAQNRAGDNLEQLIQLTCQMIRISDSENHYLVCTQQDQQIVSRQTVLKDDLVTTTCFLVRRLTLDNRGPNHPATYDAMILASDLFKDQIFGKIIQSPIERIGDAAAQVVDRYNNSRLKNVFIQFLGTICYNDPTQTPKIIENGTMKKVSDMLNSYLPVHSGTIYVLFEFLRMLIVHEQGREFIKQHKVFEKLIRPCTLPNINREITSNREEDCNLAMVIQASNHEKKHGNVALSELIRDTDPYFHETARNAVSEIIAFLTPKAEFLQKKYYEYLTECTTGTEIRPKRHFQIEVTERLIEYADYHVIKFEIDKLHTLCYSSPYDSSSLLQYIAKVFSADVIDQLLALFEILSTIKPVFDFAQRGGSGDRPNSLFVQFGQIFNVLIYEGRTGAYSGGVERFERRLREACTSLSNVFSATTVVSEQADEGGLEKESNIKKVNLMEFLKPVANSGDGSKIPEACLQNQALKSLGDSNLRGCLIANVLIVGQYIAVFAGTRKSTQESLCVTKDWSRELLILSSFMTAFNECNHKITDEFFKDQQKFVREGIVTQDQIDGISILYTAGLTSEDKAAFADKRKQIEENIDLYRENMTYLDPDHININRLLHIVWEFWRAPQQRRGHSVDEQIIASKKAYTKLTIDNLKDMDRVIDEFERLSGDFNSTDFLTTISRLYTYISELQQLIANEKLCGITFYQFVEEGCLRRLLQVFNIIKTFSLKKYGVEKDPSKQIKFIAVDCITSINKQLKNVLTHFINCSPSLINSSTPTMPELIKEDGLYESAQHFFMNYVYNLVEQLAQPEASELINSSEEKDISLHENKDLKQVQILLLKNISSSFEKCKFLKDEYGEARGEGNKPDSGRGEAGKSKKVHRDESLIEQITCMGFDRKLAKKALKLTGDVGNAVTFLLESGEAGLNEVSDSEEEEKRKSEEAKKEANDKQAREEEEQKKAKELKKDRREKLISVSDFKEYWKRVQEKGLTVVTEWSTFSPEQVKMVPYKTQKKYSKLFDEYVLSLAKSPNKNEKELTAILDKVLAAYVKNIQQLSECGSSRAASSSIDGMIVLCQDAKRHLTLLHRLIGFDSFKPIWRLNRHERESKLFENVIKTLRLLTASAESPNGSGLMQAQIDEASTRSNRVKFVFLSNVLELLYKSLLLFLVRQQTASSKKAECEHKIKELEKREKQQKENDLKDQAPREEKHSAAMVTLRQKQESTAKKFEELGCPKAAQDALKFIQLLQQNSSRLKMPQKYANELNLAIGQVIDISRIILLQRIDENKQTDASQDGSKSSLGSAVGHVDTSKAHLMLPSGNQKAAPSMTTGTSTLNIIQVQKLAFSEERLQSHIEFLIKRMTIIRAQKVAQFIKSKEEQDEGKSNKSGRSGKSKLSDAAEGSKFEQKDTVMDFKAFVAEFQSQVLGIGKAPATQHQHRHGGPPPSQQNLSQPSNEHANQLFSRIFQKAIQQTCDVVVQQEKAPSVEGKELQRLHKNGREALSSSKIQLKKELNLISEQPQPQVNDEQVYCFVFDEIQACTRPWLAELNEFVQKQKPGSSTINKIVIHEAEEDDNSRLPATAEAQQQWQELTLIQLRNLSSLARVYVDKKSGFLQSIIDAENNQNHKDEALSLVQWIKQVYLPLRLVSRHVTNKTEESKAIQEVWYDLDQSSSIEKLDRNLCLFLNELTGWGHFYSSEAKEQRRAIRHALLISCLDTLQAQAQDSHGVKQLNVLDQAQLLSSLLIIQHLTNQFNQFEYNRVVLSRQCYSQSIRALFEYGQDISSGSNLRLVQILNLILSQVVKLPAAPSRENAPAADGEVKAFSSLQTLSTLVIERSIKIFTTIALFLEGEKKREKQIKEEQKKKKELQSVKAKKKADEKKEQAKDKPDSKKEAEGGDQQQPGVAEEAKVGEARSGSQDRGDAAREPGTGLNEAAGSSLVNDDGANPRSNNDPQSPVDALMNADSDDDDDDIHGEGSQSQQHDLQIQENQLQQQQLAANADGHGDGVEQNAIGGPQAPGLENFGDDNEEYGDDQEDDADDGEDDDDEQDDDIDEGDHLDDEEIIIQQQVNMHGGHDPNVLMVDEEDEDEDLMEGEMEEEDGDDMDGDDQDDDDEMDAGFDDLPSDEDEGALFLPMGMRGHHGRHRAGGRNQQHQQRDILFNVPDGAAALAGGPGERIRLERAGGHGFIDIRAGGAANARAAEASASFGPNWSREEEEVSQTLRNLRGLSINNGGSPPANPAPHQANVLNLQQQSHRYRIELDVGQQFADTGSQQLLAQAKKSIEQIKQEQAKPLNNQISAIFQILKPIDLQGQCALAQAIDQEFIDGAINRESIRLDDEKEERQERLERIRKGKDVLPEDQEMEQLLQLGQYGEDSDDEDPIAAAAQGAGGPVALHRGDPHGLIQDRLLGRLSMDLERLLQAGAGLQQLRDPILDHLEDPFGFGGIFGGPGYAPRQLQRGRDGANQANARRDARDQAVNWDTSLFRAPEATAQDHAQSMIQAMINDEQVVIEEIEPPGAAAVGDEDAKSSEMSPSQSRPSHSQSQEEEKRSPQNPVPLSIPEPSAANSLNQPAEAANRPEAAASQFQEINDFMAGLRMDPESRGEQQQQPPSHGDSQAMLASFFGSLNQPGHPAQPNQVAGQPNVAEAQESSNNADALHGGMNGMNRAIDDIRVELQSNMQRLEQAVDRVGGQGGEEQEAQAQQPDQQDQPQMPPLVEPAQEVNGSSLVDDGNEQPQAEQAQPIAAEEQKEGEGQAATSEQADAVQQQPQPPAEEEMTFGYPNSLLRANDIDPAMLYEFPEELRAEILSTIQDQFEEWQRHRQNQSNATQVQSANVPAAANAGPSQEQHLHAVQTDANSAQLQSSLVERNEPAAVDQVHAEGQARAELARQQEQMDPEVAQAIAMGLDADFVASLPPEMRRELIQSDSIRAANTGESQPNRRPQREPEAMDVASIIATVQDPGLRREMLQNLSEEQINGLPSALRTEALNFRRGRGHGGGLFGGPPHHGNIPRPPRHVEQIEEMMMGARGDREELERQMGLFMNRINREAGHPLEAADPKKKAQVDPRDIAFDKLLMEYAAELDLQLQDEQLQSEKSESFFSKVQEQLLGGKEQEQKGSDDFNDDKLLKNILTTICLNSNVKTDIVQFLRLILKHKSQISGSANNSQNDNQHGYQFRNKIINTLTFVMKIAAQKDSTMLLALFEIEMPENRKTPVRISDLQWNKIFLTVTGILRVLIDNNKKLILHMLKCLIQRDEYFVNRGDHLVSSHAKLVESLGGRNSLRPPLAEIIQIMREQSEQHHKISKKSNLSEGEKKQCSELLIRVRNVKLLIQDVFKQFDLLFYEIALQQQVVAQSQNGKKNAPAVQQGINLGELSLDAVQSLTDLLFLPSIDKKLLTALGDFMFRLSNLKDQASNQKCEEKNLRNWSMIIEQCQNIADGNLAELNDLLLSALMTFSTFDIPIMSWGLNRTPSQLERAHSQLSNGARQGSGADQIMQEDRAQATSGTVAIAGQPVTTSLATGSKKMTQDQEDQFKQLLVQFKADSSPLMHILSLYNYFFTKFTEEKEKLASQADAIKEKIKQVEEKQTATTKNEAAEQKEKEKSKKDADATNTENNGSAAKLVPDEDKTKEIADLKKRLDGYQASLSQKEAFLENIKAFFRTEKITMLVQQISQILGIIQQTNIELIESAKNIVNCVFDCFMTEMYDEVIKGIKQKESKLAVVPAKKDARRPGQASEGVDAKDGEESRYVQMEPIAKAVAAEHQTSAEGKIAEVAGSTSQNQPEVNTKQVTLISHPSEVKRSKQRRTLIFRDVDVASDRLCQFNLFCLQNQLILNKLVKNIFSAGGRDRESAQKDIGAVSEFIKYMPNLLDFENKRLYFKKEIKKLRRASYARDLTLYIRRKDIFMDAYSQLCHLSPNELKGRITVEFTGERGQDVGGLTRDFFIELSKEMFNQNYSLFKNSDNGSTYMPNPKSYVQTDHIRYFKFIGRAIGKALFEGCLLECYFVKSVYKMLIGQKLNFRDLEDFDNNLYVGLNWCLQPSSDVDALYETFSTSEDYFGRNEIIDLVPGGRDLDLTNDNKEYYVERKAYYHLYKSVQQQMDAFLGGFYEIIPRELVSIFTYKELELLISGLPDFKVVDLKATAQYNGYTVNSPQIQWFWEVMETLDRAEKGNLLQFVTGSSKVPVEGFANLQGMNGPEPFQITRIVTSDPMRLPQGHTCFNQLDLPEYPNKELLCERLMWAIKETSGFGFA